jgi:hypothetical protein
MIPDTSRACKRSMRVGMAPRYLLLVGPTIDRWCKDLAQTNIVRPETYPPQLNENQTLSDKSLLPSPSNHTFASDFWSTITDSRPQTLLVRRKPKIGVSVQEHTASLLRPRKRAHPQADRTQARPFLRPQRPTTKTSNFFTCPDVRSYAPT